LNVLANTPDLTKSARTKSLNGLPCVPSTCTSPYLTNTDVSAGIAPTDLALRIHLVNNLTLCASTIPTNVLFTYTIANLGITFDNPFPDPDDSLNVLLVVELKLELESLELKELESLELKELESLEWKELESLELKDWESLELKELELLELDELELDEL
jgi:hypothetical protein